MLTAPRGWLVPEPFIAPELYEKYFDDQTVNGDEWTLSVAMSNDSAGGGIKQMEDHYRTFIVSLYALCCPTSF